MKIRSRLLALALFALAACSSGGGGGGSGALRLVTKGGRGTTGAGGSGGDLVITQVAGADIRVLRAGAVDASFRMTYVRPDLGANPLTVTTNTTVTPDAGNQILGDDGATPATGVWVKKGATLTIAPNAPPNATLQVSRGIYLEGTLTTAPVPASADAANLYLVAQNLVATKGARVELSGAANASGTGGKGGDLWVVIDGTILSGATITTRGGDGQSGGAGGTVDLESNVYGVWVEGDVTTSGGAGAAGFGGAGGAVNVYGSSDTLGWGGGFARGNMTLRGGVGTAGGGNGGAFYITGWYNGSARFAGNVDTSGGDATVDGDGGQGGSAGTDTYTGDVVMTGRFTTRGGNGAGAGAGGSGGSVWFDLYDDDQTFGGLIGGVVRLAVDLDTAGGDGATGGAGGDVYVENEPTVVSRPGEQVVELAGYQTIDLSGGEGGSGGSAGSVDVENQLARTYDAGSVVGGVRFEPDVVARGGRGTVAAGGNGGAFDATTAYVANQYGDSSNGVPDLARKTVVTGDLDTSGGAGATFGGNAGAVLVYDHFQVEASGAITARGGASDGAAGAGGEVQVVGDTVTGRLGATDSSGGASTAGAGGAAGEVDVWGLYTTLHGDVTAAGGASSAAGTGGAGGLVNVLSTGDGSDFRGTVAVAGGAAGIPGLPGTCRIDGIDVALTAGRYTR